MNDIQSSITQFIVNNFLFGDAGNLGPQTSLQQEGIIDSQGILELVFFLEDTLNIKVADEELTPENLDTIEKISTYVLRKQAA